MQLRAYLLLLCLAGPAYGCFLMPTKTHSKRAGVASGLLNRGSIYMDRIDDGTVARIQFTTSRRAFCQLSYFPQDKSGKPSREESKQIECSSPDKPRTEFTEVINDLQTDKLYFVVIAVWEPGGSKAKAERVTVQETAGFQGPKAQKDSTDPAQAGGDTPTTPSEDDPEESKVKEVWMARMNIPLRIAEVHKHNLPEPLSSVALQQRLTLPVGCKNEVPDTKNSPFLEATKDIEIQGLTSQDFAAASALPHPDAEGRQLLNFASINDGLDKWTLLYKFMAKDYRIPVRPISQISSMEMESTDIETLEDAQLLDSVDPLKIDSAKPLKLKWTISPSVVESSLMTIQIGRSGEDNAIFCVFQAKDGSASIDSKFLQGLDDGRHVILAELISNQILLNEKWIVSTHDWRSGRLEK